ncbi:Rv3235 family protein [Lentzea chajnantorensis]
MPPVVRRLPTYEPPAGATFVPRPRARGSWLPAPEPPPPPLDAARLLTAVLEVVDGRRPGRLLQQLALPALAARLVRSVRVRTTRLLRPPRVCHPTRFAAEIAATVRRDERVLAVAARAEHRDGRWLLTTFTVLE